MKNVMVRTLSLIVVIAVLASLAAAQAAPTPDPEQEMNSRFSKAVGVPLDKFILHYYLVKNGGVVELAAKDPSDTSTIEAIQKYLQGQKELWEKGKETVVTDIHGKFPEPAATMKKLRNEITFYMAKTDAGGVLRMFSINDQARVAIQDYMKFEISEHKTGDSPTVDQ
jgi:hypothetical protein